MQNIVFLYIDSTVALPCIMHHANFNAIVHLNLSYQFINFFSQPKLIYRVKYILSTLKLSQYDMTMHSAAAFDAE